MNLFDEMFRKITSSPHHDKMMRFALPLKEHLRIHHFWYYKISYSGLYSYLGTHHAWNEYCFENTMVDHFPCLRHPDLFNSGISLMKGTLDPEYQQVLEVAKEKFHINFNINLLKKIPEEVEAFGFATDSKAMISDEKLLSELPLLQHFIKIFREKNQPLFQLLSDYQVDLSSHLGSRFKKSPRHAQLLDDREKFLKKMGFYPQFEMTPREKDVLKWVVYGYPASYIAIKLRLKERTIENYIANIKSKLMCFSKIDLIKKAQELASIGYLDLEE